MSAVIEQTEILVDEWIGCYRGGWKGVICDEAFSHPAKAAFNLAKRIHEHAIGEGWIVAGDTIVDPFGGIGGCAFHGLMNGMIVVTNELEEKFVNLSKQNRELWREKFTGLPGFNADNWIILQGDSRKLASLISEAGLAVSSPPYSDGFGHGGQTAIDNERRLYTRREFYGETEGQLGSMKEGSLECVISSPPYAAVSPEKSSRSVDYAKQYETYRAQGGGASFEKFVATQELHSQGYGSSDGQLSNLREGDHALCVSSPPYNPPMPQDHNGSRGGKRSNGTAPSSERGAFVVYGNTPGQIEGLPDEGFQASINSPPYPQPYTSGGGINTRGYGDGSDKVGERTYQSKGGERAEGNLETLANEGFDVAISSPPYEGSDVALKDGAATRQLESLKKAVAEGRVNGRESLRVADKGFNQNTNLNSSGGNYNQTNKENLGNSRGDTFWSASRTILEQLYSVLKPGAHAIFIVKAFVRDKKIVDFPGQWAQLCEAVGFELLHDHHAMLTEHSGTQGGMFGEDKEFTVKRISFFRRLHESKSPETAIEYENVLCFLRP